ncbi:TPA: Mu transposase C-terminal domain-containing protein [Pasteurella multocida]|uniref:transposase domain-containing protein n=1 Tax=Pasteurella multocida TaxID=747 RepID=UPI001EE1DD36|nr:transposase domain-containing protein [Pasteurella multocida]MDX3990840.1 transposase domain-containing protein [Pasteurella multocida]MDY0501432.1 Mu transposase C-terminal domain-containing protein [Pasteurella multocida]MDY0634312.1 Mu transposase C-terminal domain-containing protein [Pasteurella multocida]MDY0691895.1 Mu transposase C-terminal domain-containing protein [Pasteurella multocida]BDE03608.1 Mu-like prophage FluMu transposase A [Pasteurella multocida]
MKNWVTAKEIAGIGGLSKHPTNVNRLARKEKWIFREIQGVQGGGYEYAFSSLPLEVQTEYLLKHSEELKVNKENNDSNQQTMIESAWNVLASATFEQEKRAERRFQAVVKVARLVENKIPLMKAFEQVVALYATDSDDETISKGSLKRWWYKVKTHPQGIWLPLLLDRTERDNSCRWADISDKAWAFFCADYLRKSKPKFSVCYYRLTLAAEENGWTIPSLSSLKRKFYNEFTEAEIALARGGEHELRELTAPQIRTVMDLEAYEIVNGDGYQHNVFVDWYEDGRPPIRPKTWFWQDVRTRRILSYCVDDSENGDQIRQATLRMIKQYGIPKTILMDNTRAASDKQTTQQRKRGKRQTAGIKIDGMFDRLGIKVIRTLVFKGRGNGRAKPIERAFKRDSLPAYVDGDARLEAFFTGWSVTEKTEDYQFKKGVNKALFLEVLEQGVRLWNDKAGRETELGQGIFSADQLWARDYAQTRQTFATEEQLRQLMMLGESTKVDKHGRFTLKAGYVLNNQKNVYEAQALIGGNVGSVIVRYDPDDLHGTVHIYDKNGVYLCDGECVEKVAFNSEEGARVQKRLINEQRRITKKMVDNHEKLSEHEMAQYRKQFEQSAADFVEPAEKQAFSWTQFVDGNTVKTIKLDHELETETEEQNTLSFEQDLFNGLKQVQK